VATVLRRLLDDAHMSVVTAAAEAMAVLVGPGPKEEEVWEAAHCNPGTGEWTSDCARMMTKNQGIIVLECTKLYLCPTCCIVVKLWSLMCVAVQHMCSTNASKEKTCAEIGTKSTSKKKLGSVQFILISRKGNLEWSSH